MTGSFLCCIISRTKSDPHCWAVLILSLFIGASHCTFNLFIYSSVSAKKQTQNMSNRSNAEEFMCEDKRKVSYRIQCHNSA